MFKAMPLVETTISRVGFSALISLRSSHTVGDRNGSPYLKKYSVRMPAVARFRETMAMSPGVIRSLSRLPSTVLRSQATQLRLHAAVFSTIRPDGFPMLRFCAAASNLGTVPSSEHCAQVLMGSFPLAAPA